MVGRYPTPGTSRECVTLELAALAAVPVTVNSVVRLAAAKLSTLTSQVTCLVSPGASVPTSRVALPEARLKSGPSERVRATLLAVVAPRFCTDPVIVNGSGSYVVWKSPLASYATLTLCAQAAVSSTRGPAPPPPPPPEPPLPAMPYSVVKGIDEPAATCCESQKVATALSAVMAGLGPL